MELGINKCTEKNTLINKALKYHKYTSKHIIKNDTH